MNIGLATVAASLLGSGAMVIVNGVALAQPDGKVAGQSPCYGQVIMAVTTSTAVASSELSVDVPDPIVDGRGYTIEFISGDVFRIVGASDR